MTIDTTVTKPEPEVKQPLTIGQQREQWAQGYYNEALNASESKLVFVGILAVMAEVGKLEKSGKGPSTQGSYAFLEIDDILLELRGLFVKHGIIVTPRQENRVITFNPAGNAWTTGDANTPPREIHTGKLSVHVALDVTYIFRHVIDGSELEVWVSSEATDTQDKATNKAYTAAFKTALRQTFAIVTGEDPDAIDGDLGPTRAEQNITTAENGRKTTPVTNTDTEGRPQDLSEGAPEITDDTPVDEAKKVMRKTAIDNKIPLPHVNAYGSKLTGKALTIWPTQISAIRKVIAAIQEPGAAEAAKAAYEEAKK